MAHVRRKLVKTKRHEDDILCLLQREPKNKFHSFGMDYKTAWDKHKKFVLDEWIKNYPGTRPIAWWRFEAQKIPKGTYPDCYYDGCWPIHRKRLGGTGSILHEDDTSSGYGIPTSWVTEEEIEYYNGRAIDSEGISLKNTPHYDFKEGDFIADAFDHNDPPVYESQAAYLKRYKLFLDGEEKRLTKNDFKPEVVGEL